MIFFSQLQQQSISQIHAEDKTVLFGGLSKRGLLGLEDRGFFGEFKIRGGGERGYGLLGVCAWLCFLDIGPQYEILKGRERGGEVKYREWWQVLIDIIVFISSIFQSAFFLFFLQVFFFDILILGKVFEARSKEASKE